MPAEAGLANSKSKRVLLIAFHYPPCAVSSGMQRTLAFSKHLKEFGWEPFVVSVDPRAYGRISSAQLDDVPRELIVRRTAAPDIAKLTSIRGRYWDELATPDRWWAWSYFAVPAALQLIKRHGISVIWSTYPIATAHVISSRVSRITNLPWVADFRDPMVEYVESLGQWFPSNERLRQARLLIEGDAIRRCARAVFCTEGARRIVSSRFGSLFDEKLAVVPNGFDEAAFSIAETRRGQPSAALGKRVLLHSGTIYPGADRDPSCLFKAIRRLFETGRISADSFELRLRDPSNEEYFERLAVQEGVGDMVRILPPLGYHDALAEMMEASALLILQGHTSNPAVPAKLYEYLRAGRPIIGLVDPAGETSAMLTRVGISSQVSLVDVSGICNVINAWLSADESVLLASLPSRDYVGKYSRHARSRDLALILDEAARVPRA